MTTVRQGSIWLTVLLSFAYGLATFVLVINHSELEEAYEHDILSYWLLAPVGTLCGYLGASTVHELAHFFVARLVGGHVHKIQIGSGKLWLTFRIMGTACELHESLRSGLVFYSITSKQQVRMKLALVTGAAPLASLILAGASVALLVFIWPFDKSAFSIWHYPFPFLVGWTLPCVVFSISVLVPYRYQYAGRKMETDAMKLLTIPRMTDAEIEKRIDAAQTLLASQYTVDPDTTSLEQALERVDKAPNDVVALNTAAYFLETARDPRAPVYHKKLLDRSVTPVQRVQLLDRYLTCCLELDAVSHNSEEVERLSSELMAANPGSISVMGTRGSILIDLGHINEGKAMLKEVLAKTESLIDKVYSNIFLALAEKQQGNLELARENAATAAKLDPECTALKRVSDLLLP